ncbi:MAG: DUF3347 domain-containing protein [Daejeonella sp.]
MKTLFYILAFTAISLSQTISAQERPNTINSYYAIKDALISGNANLANSTASAFIETVTADSSLPGQNKKALINDASNIAGTTDIKKQRVFFSALSESLIALSKVQKLDANPVYHAYCPMTKSSWLSASAAIKNPYYGSAMLTCGKVVGPLK